jgi:hypothetical protein
MKHSLETDIVAPAKSVLTNLPARRLRAAFALLSLEQQRVSGHPGR